jgi:hypothetical protein
VPDGVRPGGPRRLWDWLAGPGKGELQLLAFFIAAAKRISSPVPSTRPTGVLTQLSHSCVREPGVA